jgi:hypothetical protein
MRPRLPLLALLLVLQPSAALADVTVRYSAAGAGGPRLSVAVDDSGQVRAAIWQAPNVTLIRRAGVSYVAYQESRTGTMVARLDDVIALFVDILRSTRDADALQAFREMSAMQLEVREHGAETVAGRPGILYAIRDVNPGAPSAADDVVISTDPELAPVAREMVRFADSVIGALQAAMGSTPEVLTGLRALLGRGAPLRVGRQFRLEAVSAEPIPAAAFDLPGPVISREQMEAAIAQTQTI